MVSNSPKRIVIVGGVAGGMAAATRARRLDESAIITVFEKGPYAGFANCGIPYAIGGVIQNESSLILQTPQGFKNRYNIDVQVYKEVTKIDRSSKLVHVRGAGSQSQADVKQYPFDALILSQGAEAIIPPIDGIDAPNVFTLQTIPQLLALKEYISSNNCKSVTIIGGGFIGLEAAENLQLSGMAVNMMEYTSHVFPPVDPDIAEPLHKELLKNGVRLYLNAQILRIESRVDSSRIRLADGTVVIADVLLVAVGVRGRSGLALEAGLEVGKTGVIVDEFMRTSDSDIYAVGDMVETHHRIALRPTQVALAGLAARQGRLAADHIFGHVTSASPYRGNVGTTVCKVFSLTIGITGLSVRGLEKLGRHPLWITIHPQDHAGYYPGANAITLRIAFERQTGRLLGAQAVGKSGVDKRIDVLSTAIQANMTVTDLTHLELGYAPPYGSAKDPINMAGFVGSNVLAGDVQIVHPCDINVKETLRSETLVVDVRSPAEFRRGNLPGAVNIPVDDLRDAVKRGDVDRTRHILVYCQVGYRGYLAYRILKQQGFSVSNLDGGFKSVVDGGYADLQSQL